MKGELGLRKRLFQRNHARECQENEELRRICCEETDQARQARSEEMSMQQQRNLTTVSPMMAKIRDLQNTVNSLSGSSSGATHVPDQTSAILGSRTLPRCDSGLPSEIHRIVRVLWETFLKDHLFKKDYPQSSTIHRIWNLHLRSQNPDISETARREMKRESLTAPTQSPHFLSGSGMSGHTCGIYSHSGMMDYPKVPVTEWNFGKFS